MHSQETEKKKDTAYIKPSAYNSKQVILVSGKKLASPGKAK